MGTKKFFLQKNINNLKICVRNIFLTTESDSTQNLAQES